MDIPKNKFQLEHKIGMINLFRDRCDKLGKHPQGTKVEESDCAVCNDLVTEIEGELKTLEALRQERINQN